MHLYFGDRKQTLRTGVVAGEHSLVNANLYAEMTAAHWRDALRGTRRVVLDDIQPGINAFVANLGQKEPGCSVRLHRLSIFVDRHDKLIRELMDGLAIDRTLFTPDAESMATSGFSPPLVEHSIEQLGLLELALYECLWDLQEGRIPDDSDRPSGRHPH